MDFVFFTLFRTDNPYSSISLSMAKELAAQGHKVYYVNHPYTLKDVWTDRKSPFLKARFWKMIAGKTGEESFDAIPQNFRAFQPPATLPIGFLPKGALFDFFNKINNKTVLNSIRSIIRKHDLKDFVYINCYDPYYAGYLPDNYGQKLSIYHCIDDIRENPYSAKHAAGLEDEALKNADVSLVTSTNLLKIKSHLTPRLEHFFNAADIENWRQVVEKKFDWPPELAGREGRKVVGFVGNLDELRIDYPLIKKAAEAHADKTFLLIGPENSSELRDLGLHLLPNVVLAGSRRMHELPPLVQAMDVVLIPFLLNKLTKSIYPLKINEYLAAGRAVVSTSFSDDIRTFGDVIYLADGHDDFVQKIEKAIAENSAEKVAARTQTASKGTWAARIEQLFEIIKKYEKR